MQYLNDQMQVKTLSPNGIEKFLSNEKKNQHLVLQITEAKFKKPTETEVLMVTLSDGFAFLPGIFIPSKTRNAVAGISDDEYTNIVIKVNASKKMGSYQVITSFELVSNSVGKVIGSPILYDDFKKKGNTKGSNQLQENRASDKKGAVAAKKPQQTSRPQDSTSREKKKETPKKNNRPIQSLNKKPQPPSAVHFAPLSSLMVGSTDWTILVRITSKSQPKSFNGRKGQSQIMSIQFIDKDKTAVTGVFFGDSCNKFDECLELNTVYEMTGGTVQMEKDRNGAVMNTIKIIFGEKSIFKHHKGNTKIPFMEDLSISLSQVLLKAPDFHQPWDVIALVKSVGPIENLKTKQMKDMPKRQIVVCDPDQQIQISMALFFNLAQLQFQQVPHYFKGVYVGEYQGKKQFSMSFKSSISPLRDFKFKSRRQIEDIQFTKGVEPASEKSHEVSTIEQLLLTVPDIQGNTVKWHQVRCHVNTVRLTGTLWYMGTPCCKKKVQVDEPGTCEKCNAPYPKPRYYYILNIEISDSSQTLWVTVYDEVAEVLMDKVSADRAKSMQPEEFRQAAKAAKNKEVKFLIMSKGQTYEGTFRVKHTVSKMFPLDHIVESQNALKTILSYEYAD